MSNTEMQFDKAAAGCQSVFEHKMKDYGTAWRSMRPSSVTDQILIKVNRVRTLEIRGVNLVGEGIKPELIGIINYAIMGLIQLELSFADEADLSAKEATAYYVKYMAQAKALMMQKNHDYDEVWRSMRLESYTDLILMKLYRTKQIEDNHGATSVSEGIDENYFDIINYAIFGLIKMQEQQDEIKI